MMYSNIEAIEVLAQRESSVFPALVLLGLCFLVLAAILKSMK